MLLTAYIAITSFYYMNLIISQPKSFVHKTFSNAFEPIITASAGKVLTATELLLNKLEEYKNNVNSLRHNQLYAK